MADIWSTEELHGNANNSNCALAFRSGTMHSDAHWNPDMFPKLERVLGADLKEKQYKSKGPMAEK